MNILEKTLAELSSSHRIQIVTAFDINKDIKVKVERSKGSGIELGLVDFKALQRAIATKEGTQDYLEILHEFGALSPLIFKSPLAKGEKVAEKAIVLLPSPKAPKTK